MYEIYYMKLVIWDCGVWLNKLEIRRFDSMERSHHRQAESTGMGQSCCPQVVKNVNHKQDELKWALG